MVTGEGQGDGYWLGAGRWLLVRDREVVTG